MAPTMQQQSTVTLEQANGEKANCALVEGWNTLDGIKSFGSSSGIGGNILVFFSPCCTLGKGSV
jgi:hypothetical protein